jgi:hypothetical protein
LCGALGLFVVWADGEVDVGGLGGWRGRAGMLVGDTSQVRKWLAFSRGVLSMLILWCGFGGVGGDCVLVECLAGQVGGDLVDIILG